MGYVLTRGGGQAVQSEVDDVIKIAVQSEMLISKVHLGYVLTRGGGQAVQGGLSCPPPRISERIDNPQILLHHLLQEYLVERDINIISINLRSEMLTSKVQLGYVLTRLWCNKNELMTLFEPNPRRGAR